MAKEIISKLLNYLGDNYGLDYDDLGLTAAEIEYCKEIIEPREFKVGDKVIYDGREPNEADFIPRKGTVGTVLNIDSRGIMLIEWPADCGTRLNTVTNSYAWYYAPSDVKIYKED